MDGLVSQGHQESSWVKVFVGNSEPKSCFKYSREPQGFQGRIGTWPIQVFHRPLHYRTKNSLLIS